MLGLYRVSGDSMLPNYCSGDYVLTRRVRAPALAAGDVVVVRHPVLGRLIKRIIGFDTDSALIVAGDNAAASTSSEALGPVPGNRVQGKVIWHIRQPRRQPRTTQQH